MKTNKRVLLVGKAGSGKDYFRDFLLNEGFKPSVSHTTRPKREGEVDGETYHFVSKTIFDRKISDKEMFEHKEFNGWMYGTSIKEMTNADVFIFTPSGIKDLSKEFLLNSIIVYFDIPTGVRVSRMLKRSDADCFARRLLADEEDFRDFDTFNIKVSDPEFCCEEVLDFVFTFDYSTEVSCESE